MQLGLSTYTLPWHFGVAPHTAPVMSIRQLIHLAAQQNIYRVQIGDNAPLHELSASELQQLKDTANNLSVQIEAGTRGLTATNIETYLSIAQYLGAPFLRVVIDDAGYHPAVPEVIQIIQQLLPQLRERKIILAIENHDRFKAQTLVEIIEATNPQWVGICLDTANSLGAGEGIETVLQHLAPYTINLHIKDIIIKRVAHKMGFTVEGAAAGKGMLPLKQIIKTIEAHQRCQSVTLEVWSNPLESTEATLQQEQQWANESIQFLKTILT